MCWHHLGCKQGLLIFSTVEEVELGLNGAEPMVGFQRLACFSESWRLGGQLFHIGAPCLISSITNHGAITVGIGHEVVQQFWSTHSLTHRLMRGLEPRLVEAMSAHPIGRSRHPPSHHECSPCCYTNDLPLVQKSNPNNNPDLSNAKGDNSRVKCNNH
jgi:hypothetical protein